MAIQKEIWLRDIVEDFFPDDSFVSKSVNDDAWNDGKRVHVPNAGSMPEVEMDRERLPADVEKRTDVDVEYEMHEFTTSPILITNADQVELSYDKRRSVISGSKKMLQKKAHEFILGKWAPSTADHCIVTTGNAVDTHLSDTTGKRKAITTKELLSLMTLFNDNDIPEEGRYLLLDAHMYTELLASMTESEKQAFFQYADLRKGIVGQLCSINVMRRSSVLRYAVENGNVTGIATKNAATDCAAGLAWYEGLVRRSRGDVELFEESRSPVYYGDIISTLLRAGGCASKSDYEGVYAIVGITAGEAQAAGE